MGYSGKVLEQRRARELRSLSRTLQEIATELGVTEIPPSQFTKPYRAQADPTIRHTKHVMGCPGIVCRSASIHRRVLGLIEAVLSPTALPG
jgi:hypothetical protein